MSQSESYLRLQFVRVPGWLAMIALAAFSTGLSGLVEIGGKHPLEAAVVAILLGIILRNFAQIPDICEPGCKAFEKLLVLGIVFVGASLDFSLFLQQGIDLLVIIATTMILGFVATLYLARVFRLTNKLGVLLGVGTTICGGTAIAVTAPVIEAKEEETSYAIGTIAVWGLLAILIYPAIARVFNIDDYAFGIFAGTAVHSTPQVVGAGYIYSDLAGEVATAVKLVRNCFLAPVALLVALWYRRQTDSVGSTSVRKAFPWFLFGYFVMAWLNTEGMLPTELARICVRTGKFLILCGMVGVGLNTRFSAFRNVGIRPAIVGLCGAIIVAVVSMSLISWLV